MFFIKFIRRSTYSIISFITIIPFNSINLNPSLLAVSYVIYKQFIYIIHFELFCELFYNQELNEKTINAKKK